MAEGGNFSRSIEKGSDIVYEFECTPCAADGSRFEALQFCQTCDQFLCVTCTKYHKRFTKSHRLAPAGSTKHSSVQSYSKNKLVAAKCHFHPDRDVELYCGTHDMVYCRLCIAMEHRSCNNVEEIKDGVYKPNTSRLQLLVATIDRVNEELYKTKRDNYHNLKLMKTKKADLLKEIDKLRKEMNNHLDHLERRIKAELDEEFTKLEQKIRDDITAADDLLTTTNECKPNLACNKGDKSMFIAEKLGQNAVSDANAFLVKVNKSERESFTFERNTRLYDSMKGADHMGRIVRKSSILKHTKRSKYIVNFSYQTNVNVSTDTSTSLISGMCQLQDGTILIADYKNSKLKRLDDQLNVKDFVKLKSQPVGLCSISHNEVAVRYTQSIHFIRVGKSLSLGKVIKIKKFVYTFNNSIAFCEDNLWTLVEKCIFVYSTSGVLVKKIDSDSKGHELFSFFYPQSMAVSNDGTKVYVTTCEDRAVVFNTNGDVLRELRDKRLDGSRGICITEDDIVLVAGSNNIVMFDSDGNSLGELVTYEDMLSDPYVLCYDRTKCHLLVSSIADEIQIYELNE